MTKINTSLDAQIEIAEQMKEINNKLELMLDLQRTFLREIIQTLDRKGHDCKCKTEPEEPEPDGPEPNRPQPFKFKDLTS
jgi:hypothetical protein